MNLANLQLFSALTRRMNWLGDRQRVLAQNIANANTPDYMPHDLKPMNFRSLVQPERSTAVTLAATDGAHLSGRRATSAAFRQKETSDAESLTLSGNAVDLESDLQKVAETGMDYQTMSNLYRRQIEMMKTALGRGGSS